MQSQFVNNVCKLLQLLEVPDSLQGLRPWIRLGISVPRPTAPPNEHSWCRHCQSLFVT